MAGVVIPAGMGSLPTMDSLAAEAEGGDENAGAAAAADAAPQSSGILEAVAEGSLEKVEAVLKAMEEASSARSRRCIVLVGPRDTFSGSHSLGFPGSHGHPLLWMQIISTNGFSFVIPCSRIL